MISRLRKDIETALNRRMQTPKDFEFLRERVYARLHILISRTTLIIIAPGIELKVSPYERSELI